MADCQLKIIYQFLNVIWWWYYELIWNYKQKFSSIFLTTRYRCMGFWLQDNLRFHYQDDLRLHIGSHRHSQSICDTKQQQQWTVRSRSGKSWFSWLTTEWVLPALHCQPRFALTNGWLSKLWAACLAGLAWAQHHTLSSLLKSMSFTNNWTSSSYSDINLLATKRILKDFIYSDSR